MSTDGTQRAIILPLLRARVTIAPEPVEPLADVATSADELIVRLKEGDEEAALTLFRRFAKLAMSVGYKVLQDEGEAEDFAQEFFLDLCAEAGSFDGAKGSARTWIVQMIYRRAFDRRAYLCRRQFYLGTEDGADTNTLVGARDPEDTMIDRLTVQQLKTAFTELTDDQRKTLEMFFFEGLTFAEIAERTGEEVENVRHHYYRGLERLRQTVRKMMRGRKFRR